jgi:hypothetical protein
MSALPPKADIATRSSERPLSASSGRLVSAGDDLTCGSTLLPPNFES